MKKTLCAAVISILLASFFTTCGGTRGAGISPSGGTLKSIEITSTNPTIAKGTTQQYTATGIYDNNSAEDITTLIDWKSSNTAVATIDSSGVANAIAVGTTTITASYVLITASTPLTVTAAELVSISVTPTNPSIALGTTQQFTATGTYSDNSIQNITTSAVWSSSSPSTAIISNATGSNGLATPVAAGSTTIAALSGSASGTTTLTITP